MPGSSFSLSPPPTPAEAYFRQRHAVAERSSRLLALRQAIDDPVNLSTYQWAQWFSYVLDYRPDVILELGRGMGNSTAAFAEALRCNGHGRLVSFDVRDLWRKKTAALLRPLVEVDWFDRVEARVQDLLEVEFAPIFEGAKRVLVLWDAHGFAIADVMFASVMPLLQEREHMVIMHDISDRRYCGSRREYGDAAIWQGGAWVHENNRYESRLHLGWIDTVVDQPIVALDFLSRNGTELRSADQSFHEEIGGDPERKAEMGRVLQGPDWSMIAHWAWFTLNGVPGPYTFPRRATGADVVLKPVPAKRRPGWSLHRILTGIRARRGD